MGSSKLRVGVIGLGVGLRHLEVYSQHPACEVVSICDFDLEKLKAVKEKYPASELTSTAEEVLKDPRIDLVSIASYDQFHCEQILTAIEHDKDVFVEKPLCIAPEEAERIWRALEKKPEVRISSNLILRKYPRFRRVKEKIGSGALGALFSLEGDYNYGRIEKILSGWRSLGGYSVILGGGIHVIDLLLWFSGRSVDEVMAYGNRMATEGTCFKGDDFSAGLLHFSGGAIGKVSANFGCVYPHFHRLALYGTKGTFINEQQKAWFYFSRDPKVNPESLEDPYPGVEKGELLIDFIEAILSKTEVEVGKQEIFSSLSVAFALEKSKKESRPIKVTYF